MRIPRRRIALAAIPCIQCVPNYESGIVRYKRGRVLLAPPAEFSHWCESFHDSGGEHHAYYSNFYWDVLYRTYTRPQETVLPSTITDISPEVLFVLLEHQANVERPYDQDYTFYFRAATMHEDG